MRAIVWIVTTIVVTFFIWRSIDPAMASGSAFLAALIFGAILSGVGWGLVWLGYDYSVKEQGK